MTSSFILTQKGTADVLFLPLIFLRRLLYFISFFLRGLRDSIGFSIASVPAVIRASPSHRRLNCEVRSGTYDSCIGIAVHAGICISFRRRFGLQIAGARHFMDALRLIGLPTNRPPGASRTGCRGMVSKRRSSGGNVKERCGCATRRGRAACGIGCSRAPTHVARRRSNNNADLAALSCAGSTPLHDAFVGQ